MAAAGNWGVGKMNYVMELKDGEFRTSEKYWLYLGLFSLISIALLAASIVDWRVDGNIAERALPGNNATNEAVYVTVLGEWSMELKTLEYLAISILLILLFICYVMSYK